MQLVIFDVDGTLTQTTRVDEACFVRAVADVLGTDGIDTRWAAYTHSTDSGIAEEIFRRYLARPPSSDELLRLQQRFVSLLQQSIKDEPQCCVEIPGARAAFSRLRQESGWTVALATGGWRASAQVKLHAAGFTIDDIPAAFADDSPSREAIIRTALSRAAECCGTAGFTRIVYVGDATWDVRAAIRLQLPFLGVGGERRALVLRRTGAKHVVRDFTHVDGLLASLETASVPIEPPGAD